MFNFIKACLTKIVFLRTAGAMSDATIIAAPRPTKNATQTPPRRKTDTRSGHQWHFAITTHVGTDMRRLVHSLTTTDAKQHDITQLAQLLHGQDSVLYSHSYLVRKRLVDLGT